MIAKTSACLLGILLCLFCGGFIQSAWAYSTEDLKRLKATGSCPRCDLSAATSDELQLFRSNLSGANLSGANLFQNQSHCGRSESSRLVWGNFIWSEPLWADLSSANLSTAELLETKTTLVDFSGAKLERASLEKPTCSKKLPNTDLSWVSFRGANLTLADFYKSDLWQAICGVRLMGRHVLEC